MQRLAFSVAATVCASFFLAGISHGEPGYQWEMKMEMEGMPFPMPAQKVCALKTSKEPPVSKDDGECKMLEKKQAGNRFQWKAQCKDGSTVVGDITGTETQYSGTMKMTQKSGETMNMKMAGKRLGDCDYQDRSGEFKAMQQQSEAAIAKSCKDALSQMQGGMFVGDTCPKEKPVFCQKLATLDGYNKASKNIPYKMINDPGVGLGDAAKACGLDNGKLLSGHCARGVSENNFGFVSRLCPADMPKLCGKAVAGGRLDYVRAHCPSEKAALIKKHCEGRQYTSQIEAKYQDFCANAAEFDEIADDGSAKQGKADDKKSAGGRSSDAGKEESAIPSDVQEGVKKLKGLFGL